MTEQQCFLVRFWGVRGSYPTPGLHTVRHGGNTACIEVQAGNHTLILDAGTGAIGLGKELLQRAHEKQQINLALFLSHAHGDHLIGFPFFAPLFDPRTNIHIIGPKLADQTVEQLVTPLMSPPYFPVDLRGLPSQRTFHTITAGKEFYWFHNQLHPTLNLQESSPESSAIRIIAHFTSTHPCNGSVIYRIEYAGRSIVYATDVEWYRGCEEAFLTLAQETDLLIHDAQYTSHDYQRDKRGFGHSTLEMAIEAARATHAHELILFHHEPTYDDQQLDSMEQEAQKHFANTRSAYEGLEIDLLRLA